MCPTCLSRCSLSTSRTDGRERPEHRAPLGKVGGETIGPVEGAMASAGVVVPGALWCPVHWCSKALQWEDEVKDELAP